MPQSISNVPVHFVFSTKQREPLVADEWAAELHAFIGGIVRDTKCGPLGVGGVADHVHVLATLGRDVTQSDLMRAVKAYSSGWVRRRFALASFAWQAGYAGLGVGPDGVPAVQAYIRRQKEHHAGAAFQDEYRAMLTASGEKWDERYIWD